MGWSIDTSPLLPGPLWWAAIVVAAVLVVVLLVRRTRGARAYGTSPGMRLPSSSTHSNVGSEPSIVGAPYWSNKAATG